MISVADLRDYLKAEEADDGVLEALERGAVATLQTKTGRYFGPEAEITETRSWRAWPLVLSNQPVGGAITSVEIRSGGAWESADASSYYVEGAYIWSDGWLPGAVYSNPLVRITYPAGYEVDADDPAVWAAPEDVKDKVRQIVALRYQYREAGAVGTAHVDVESIIDDLCRDYVRAAL